MRTEDGQIFRSSASARAAFRLRRSRLRKLLSSVSKKDFLSAIWLLDWRKIGSEAFIPEFEYPLEVLHAKMPDPMCIYSWELESLLIECFSVQEKTKKRLGRIQNWGYFRSVINSLRSADNAKAIDAESLDIYRSITRSLYQQLPWQLNDHHFGNLARWQELFKNTTLRDMFVDSVGTSPRKFMLIGFAMYGIFKRKFEVTSFNSYPDAYFSKDDFRAFIKATSRTSKEFASESSRIARESSSLMLRESPFRRTPLVRFPSKDIETYVCPLHQPLLWRIAEGMYYDVIGRSGAADLIGKEFEKVQQKILKLAYPSVTVSEESRYGRKGSEKLTPDIIIKQNNEVKIVIECKAKKLDLKSRYASGLGAAESVAIKELAKGVVQLARFRSDLMRGITGLEISEEDPPHYVLLTIDDWMFSGRTVKDDVFCMAEKMMHDKNIEKTFDIREIIMCTATELDELVTCLNFEDLRSLLSVNKKPEYRHYSVSVLRKEFFPGSRKWRDHPLVPLLDIAAKDLN